MTLRVRRVVCTVTGYIFDTTAKLETVINHIENKQFEGDDVMIGKHLSKELEIFEATSETTKNFKLLINSLNIIPQTSIELERAEHDSTIAKLIIFIS